MLSVKGKELCALLRLVLKDKDEFVCTMLALTYKQKKPDENYQKMIDEITDCLASMTKEERLAWFRKSQYPHPLNFQKEIGGTIYTVNTHFNAESKESIKEKAERILQKP